MPYVKQEKKYSLFRFKFLNSSKKLNPLPSFLEHKPIIKNIYFKQKYFYSESIWDRMISWILGPVFPA